MMWVFPDDPFIFRVGSPGTPIYSPFNDSITVYEDAGGTTRAAIRHMDNTLVYNSTLMLEDATIPSFYGPDSVTELWAAQITGNVEGDLFPLYALPGPRLDQIEEIIDELVSSSGVLSVNDIDPDDTGNVTLTAEDLGAATTDSVSDALTSANTYTDTKTFHQLHTQMIASDDWIISHTFDHTPAVLVYDMSGIQLEADVSYPDSSTVEISFAYLETGYAELS